MTALSPRNKLIAASAMLLLLPIVAVLQGASAATAARVVLGLLALAGLVVWFVRAKGGLPLSRFKAAARLTVVQRVGLSARSGVALIEVDGRPYLVVHGDGFARIRPTARPKVVAPRPTSPDVA
ncbi:MAG: flagellar biosynthetic protein FliO [Myxococcota bacterium]